MVYCEWRRSRLVRCVLCGGAAEPGCGVCPGCAAELPALGTACHSCALPLPPSSGASHRKRQCPACLTRTPALSSAHCAWHYGFPINQLIQRFKYDGDLAAGFSLSALAAKTLADQIDSLDLLVPVPLHWWRYWRRGFNQAELVAAALGQAWGLPVGPRVLRKSRPSSAQQSLDRRQRLRNLSGSFTVRANVEGCRVGLVDDVITTGATMESAATALLAAGAMRVSAIALARTP
ncbi:hypothetical protein Maes01_00947 [Microbulbifer aestuariivivens]|uniref:Phosphoribosyltransferase domain-containing protein n=1 Tax=Microbulbifer aestuariivivens TaxID=1908308 RepID=A0ABP9WME6_9GAMM